MKHLVILSSGEGPLGAVIFSVVRQQRWLVAGCHAITLLMLDIHFYVRTLPTTPTALPEADSAEAAWWGLWPITYLPTWALIVATTLIVSYIIGWWCSEFLLWPQSRITNHESRITLPLLFALLSLLLILAFYTFPIVHTRWGDAYLLSKAIGWPDPTLRLTHSWQAPLDVFLHSQLWLRWHERFGWTDALPVYRLLSPVAGFFYLLAAVGVARNQSNSPRWLTFGLLTSLGVLQLFFGYIENYSFAAAGILLYLWLGLRVVTGRSPLWLAASALALTNAFHPSTVILAPSLLYCGWVCWRKQRRTQNKSTLGTVLSTGAAIVLPLLIGGLAVIGLMEWGGHGLAALMSTDRPGGGDGRPFVPLWATTTRWEHYTMFSWLHLRDFLNQQLLVAPVVLPGLLLVMLAALGEKVRSRQPERTASDDAVATQGVDKRIFRAGSPRQAHEPVQPARTMVLSALELRLSQQFLCYATVSYLLFIWLWNPDYGGQRDWDLFSLAAIPSALLLATTLPRRFADLRYLQAGTIPLLMLQWFQLAAWVYQNTLPWDWPS